MKTTAVLTWVMSAVTVAMCISCSLGSPGPDAPASPTGDDAVAPGSLYYWNDGEQTWEVKLELLDFEQTPPTLVFRSTADGTLMTLPGGVIVVLDSSWSERDTDVFFSDQGIVTNQVTEMEGFHNGYFIDTGPGLQSMDLSNHLASQPGVVSISPNWQGQFFTTMSDPSQQDPPEDRHGNTPETATTLVLDESVVGLMSPDYIDDVDYFRIDITEEIAGKHSFYMDLIWDLSGKPYLVIELVDEEGNCLSRPCGELTGFSLGYNLDPGTYYLRITGTGEPTAPDDRAYFIWWVRDVEYDAFIDSCSAIETKYDDPLYGCQWHLNNTEHNKGTPGVPGADINVEPVWDSGILGQGINVVIVDTGMDDRHEDLRDNVDWLKNHDYRVPQKQRHRIEPNHGEVYNPRNQHGTQMAGFIAARDNDLGARGVAPRATIYAYNLITFPAVHHMVSAMTRGASYTAVSNNSYGLAKYPRLAPIPDTWELAIEAGVRDGLDGKGVFYVFPTGYDPQVGGDSNLSEMPNHYGVTAVCAVSPDGKRVQGSGVGFSNWISAPSGTLTTGNLDAYGQMGFLTNSAATAVLSGVAALVRSANTDLTWRDVKLILAASAQKNEPGSTNWETGSLQYGSTTERYSYNPEYGFGVVDAQAAVDLAQSWTNLPPMQSVESKSSQHMNIPDAPSDGTPTTVLKRLRLNGEVDFTEYVEVKIDFDHAEARDLRITLESPTGTLSTLLNPFASEHDTEFRNIYRFGSARHLGENPNGQWILRLTDEVSGETGDIKGWSIKVYGHKRQVPSSPVNLSVSPHYSVSPHDKGQLAVQWEAPASGGAFPLTGYTVQWKESASSWDIPDDVSETTVTGTSHVITGLTAGIEYTVRIIATNASGGSPASVEASATPQDYIPPELTDAKVNRATVTLTYNEALDGKSKPPANSFTVMVEQDNIAVEEVAIDENSVSLSLSGTVPAERAVLVTYQPPAGRDTSRTLQDTAGNKALRFSDRSVVNESPVWSAMLTVGADTSYIPVASGYSAWGMDGTLSTDTFILGGTTYRVQILAHQSDGLVLVVDRKLQADFTLGIGNAQYERRDGSRPLTMFTDAYWWEARDVNWSAGDTLEVSLTLTSEADTPLPQLPLAPPTAYFRLMPENHNGVDAFTFRLHFSQDIATGREALRDHSFEVTGGSVIGAERVNGLNRIWEITLTPASIGNVTVALPSGRACEVQGAVCTADNRMLYNRPEFTVPGPKNNPATGAPTISGRLWVGETLTADTLGIADEDGLTNATFRYQWLAAGASIAGATGITYTLADADEQKAIRVRVRFTDDVGHEEALTSEASARVSVGPPRGLRAVAEDGAVNLSWIAPNGANAVYNYRILRHRPEKGESEPLVYVEYTGSRATVFTDTAVEPGVLYLYRVQAADLFGFVGEASDPAQVRVPQSNTPATGAPTISGTAQVGETLTTNTSGVADADGLSNVQYEYQWLADDTDIAGATGLTYTLTDSEESKAITVRVSFTDDADNEETLTSAATAAVAGAQPTEPPAKPRNLSATASHDSVTLTWDDPGDDSITGYVILRRIPGIDSEGHFDVLVADTGTAATTYTDNTVAAETRYTYRIKAINGAGTSERSRWSHIDTPAAPVPDKPTGLEATESDGQVVLTWDDPGDDSITGYVILRRVRENNTGGDFSVLVADTGTAALTYTDDTVAAGLTYTYRIKAINEHGTSERSRWFHIDIPAAP